MKTGLMMSVVAGLVAAPALAAPIAVTNAGFEAPGNADGANQSGAVAGWTSTTTVNAGTENHNDTVYAGADASEGTDVYWNNVGFGPAGTLTSDTVGVLAAGTYTLTADFLFRTDSISTDSFPDTNFGLSVDGGATILGTAGTATDALDVGGAGAIVTRTYTLVVAGGDANIGSNYVIDFDFAQNNAGSWNQAAIDNVTLDFVAVPEPGSLALLGLGGLMIARRRRG